MRRLLIPFGVGLFLLASLPAAAQSKGEVGHPPVVELPSSWRGEWVSDDGEFRYSFVLSLFQSPQSEAFVEGAFEWTLEEGPGPYQGRLGETAIEWVTGRPLGRSRMLILAGYAVSDSTLIAADAYRLVMSGDAIGGSTRGNEGLWLNALAGVRIRE